MFKRFTVAVAALLVLTASAFAAGTVPGFSLAQQQDSNGTPLVGCKLYTIQAGTVSTPQSGYQDSALTLPLPNPIICDAYGRLPQIFLADGSIKLRLTKSNGVQVFAADGILVVGASSGGGGGSPVDATTILATGDLKVRYGTGVVSGFVRVNGRTIGSATSGATERANADCQTLYEYLWTADANLTVSTGRGASANADWVANKTITLPDWRGRVIAGLDDMGNTAAGRRTVTYTGVVATVLGSASTHLESHTLDLTQLPTGITSATAGVISMDLGGKALTRASTAAISELGTSSSGAFRVPNIGTTGTWDGVASLSTSGVVATTSNNTGGLAHSVVDPTMFATIYLKL